ncbi:MAG TPA: exosortase/archaeosortase family protein [Vicinamibacterales bacterium]|nr:exosortase/archaeosortase family protein [Vicinamibacterales bacterium]
MRRADGGAGRATPGFSSVAATVVVAATVIAYRDVLTGLAAQWASDGNWSHGFLVGPVAAWLAWRRRAGIAAARPRPSDAGLALIGIGVALFAIGRLGSELFLTRLSLVVVVTGSVLALWGPRRLRAVAFPLAFLLLAIPWPAILFNQLAFPLQLLASLAGEACLRAGDVPVLREGNLLVLPGATLEVAEACSGIRSLVSLTMLALVVGEVALDRPALRAALVVLTPPVAVAANAARVAATGFAAHYWGPAAARGVFHGFSGWIVFSAALVLLLLLARALAWLDRAAPAEARRPAVAEA